MSEVEKKYGTLIITLKKGDSDNCTKGIFINGDLYITAERDGNKIKVYTIAEKGKYSIRRHAPKCSTEHVNEDLLEEIEIHDQKARERESAGNKKNKAPEKKPRQVYRVNPGRRLA